MERCPTCNLYNGNTLVLFLLFGLAAMATLLFIERGMPRLRPEPPPVLVMAKGGKEGDDSPDDQRT